MSNSVIPVDRYDAKESGRAIQEAQNATLEEGAKATVAFLRELLSSLKLPEKSAYVQISIDDSVAYRATVRPQNENQVRELSSPLNDEQLRYLKEVIQLPESTQPAEASFPLNQDVIIEVNDQEVFRLKNGVVEKNLLAPALAKTQTALRRSAEPTAGSVIEGQSAHVSEVQIVEEDVSSPQPAASLSGEQKQELQSLGVNPDQIERAIGQQAQGNVPVIIVLNREVENNVQKSSLKDNLKSGLAGFQKAVRDLSKKVSSFLGSVRDKVLPRSDREIRQDLQNLAAINVASKLLDHFGGGTEKGRQVFEGNSFRLERQGKDLSVIAKDGRGTILSLQGGELKGSLRQRDVETFRAVDRQLGQSGRSRQSQAELG